MTSVFAFKVLSIKNFSPLSLLSAPLTDLGRLYMCR